MRISRSADSGASAAVIRATASSITRASLCTGRMIDRPFGAALHTLVLLVIDVISLIVGLRVEAEIGSRQVRALAIVVHQDMPLAAGPRRNPFVHAPGVEQD